MNGLFQDLRFAARTLRRSPGFTLVAVLTLALGVGANTAIFSVVNAVLLRPLPFSESERLMTLWEAQPGQGDELTTVSLATYRAWAEHSRTFSEWGAYSFDVASITGGTEPVQVNGLGITSSFLPMLGVTPHLGRGFLPEDDVPGGARRMLLSHALWERNFGADPTIVGRTVERDGAPFEVVGVLPRGFEFPPAVKVGGSWVAWSPEVFVPVGSMGRQAMEEPRFFVLARLATGVSQEQARSEMTALSAALDREQGSGADGVRMHVVALQELVVGPLRPALLALLGAVGLVLLIACVNVGGLQLARLAGREREAGLRSALGARRSRIAQQLLTEAGLLAMLGGAFGVILAFGGLRVIRWLAPADLPRLDAASIDGRVLGFALVLTFVTGLLFGLLPALRASRGNLRGLLAGSGRGTVGTRSARRARAALLAAEVAFAVTLVTGAGLLIRSFSALSRVDPGFRAERLLTFELMLPPDRYPARAQVLDFYDQLEDRLATLPGVLAVSAIDRLPFGQYSSRVDVRAVGDGAGTPEARMALNVAARPAYFETMGIHLLRGRGFTRQDREDAPPVVVVSRTLAERSALGENPIGERVVAFNREWEIVGVAEDVRHFGPAVAPEPMIYFPQAQDVATRRLMTLTLRTSGESEALVPAVREQVRSVDPRLPISRLQAFGTLRSAKMSGERFLTALVGTFAGLALVLAMVGVGGVMSYTVAQRTREIGVRMALGATRESVLGTVLRQAAVVAGIGTIVGFAAAVPLAGAARSLLFGIEPQDPLTLGAVGVLLPTVALLAAWVPARRAARVDPMIALRAE